MISPKIVFFLYAALFALRSNVKRQNERNLK